MTTAAHHLIDLLGDHQITTDLAHAWLDANLSPQQMDTILNNRRRKYSPAEPTSTSQTDGMPLQQQWERQPTGKPRSAPSFQRRGASSFQPYASLCYLRSVRLRSGRWQTNPRGYARILTPHTECGAIALAPDI